MIIAREQPHKPEPVIIAYAAKWSVTGDRVTHEIEIATRMPWVGTQQLRHFAFEGNRLILSPPVSADFTHGKVTPSKPGVGKNRGALSDGRAYQLRRGILSPQLTHLPFAARNLTQTGMEILMPVVQSVLRAACVLTLLPVAALAAGDGPVIPHESP